MQRERTYSLEEVGLSFVINNGKGDRIHGLFFFRKNVVYPCGRLKKILI